MRAISGAWRRSPMRSVGWNPPRVALRTDLRHEITLAQGCHGPLQGSQVDMDPSAGQFLRWGPRSHRSPAAAAPARRRRVSGRRGRGRGRGPRPPAGAPRAAPRPIPGAVGAAASPGRSGGWRATVALIAVHVADGPADIHGQRAEGRLEHEAGDGQLAGLLTTGGLERDVSGGPAGPGDPIALLPLIPHPPGGETGPNPAVDGDKVPGHDALEGIDRPAQDAAGRGSHHAAIIARGPALCHGGPMRTGGEGPAPQDREAGEDSQVIPVRGSGLELRSRLCWSAGSPDGLELR